jgi:hypothetical protein
MGRNLRVLTEQKKGILCGLDQMAERVRIELSHRFWSDHPVQRRRNKDLQRASGEFAMQTPSSRTVTEFLRSSFRTHYRKMWVILA